MISGTTTLVAHLGYPTHTLMSSLILTNIRGALVTMRHKVTTMELVDEISPAAAIAGATNAVLRREDGSLLADQFDGAGFVRGVLRMGFNPSGKRALVVGNDGSVLRLPRRWLASAWPRSACSIPTRPPLKRSPSASACTTRT